MTKGIIERESIDEEVKALGFDGEEDFFLLLGKVKLTDCRTLKKFLEWEHLNGTKKGLLKLLTEDANAE